MTNETVQGLYRKKKRRSTLTLTGTVLKCTYKVLKCTYKHVHIDSCV